jgi:hypothetical protein
LIVFSTNGCRKLWEGNCALGQRYPKFLTAKFDHLLAPAHQRRRRSDAASAHSTLFLTVSRKQSVHTLYSLLLGVHASELEPANLAEPESLKSQKIEAEKVARASLPYKLQIRALFSANYQ